MERLVAGIKDKAELRALDDAYVLVVLQDYLRVHEPLRKQLENNGCNPRSKAFAQAQKAVRALLRERYGVFIKKGYAQRKGLLKALHDDSSFGVHKELLATHQSTRERLPYYEYVYPQLFAITGLPSSILDLGCGLNPLSYPLLGCTPLYTAIELAAKDAEFLQAYFDTLGIKGKARSMDLLRFDPKGLDADVCLCFKLLDTLESIQRNISFELLENIPAKWIAISFPAVSIGGRKRIKDERRSWLMKFLNNHGWPVECFTIPNEHFIVVKKQ